MIKNDNMISKSLEKLSSGLKINRAADDAAGLIISEQMRAQIAGLNQAVDNTETAVAMVQTAEGALDEMNTLLNKARELALHAANDGANDSRQLEADQSELDNIISSITRIANNTQFGTKKLLDGSLEQKSDVAVSGGTLANTKLDAVVGGATATLEGVKHLAEGSYSAHLTRNSSTSVATAGAVTNQTAAFTGGTLTASTAAASLLATTDLDAGNYQVALRNSSGNVFLTTFNATHTATGTAKALSGTMNIGGGTSTAAASLASGTALNDDATTHVTAEVTNLDGNTLSINGASLAGNAVTATHTLDAATTYTLAITDGTTSYSESLLGTGTNDVQDLVDAFNAKAANVTAGVTATWSGAGAPAITFSGTGSQAGALGDGFYATLSDGSVTSSAAADATTTGVTGTTRSYTVSLEDSLGATVGTYTKSGITAGTTYDMDDLLADFQANVTFPGGSNPVTAVSGVQMNATSGQVDFNVTVDGGVNANGFRLRITDGASNSILSAASTGSAANMELDDLVAAFDTAMTAGGVAADATIDGSGLDIAINSGLATGAASNGFSIRITNLANSAVVDSTATAGGSGGVEVAAQVELRDASGTAVAVLTGGAGADIETVSNTEYGITLDLDATYAQNAASIATAGAAAIGVSFAYTDDADNVGAVFQIGANRDQTVAVSINSAKATDLGRAASGTITDPAATLDSLRTGAYLANGLAQEAISVIDKAIDDITNLRGELGAVQANSLESNLSSLRATLENTTAAESVIRDVDFAAESAMFTRNSILIQASTAMLAQANQLPQNVLKLLG